MESEFRIVADADSSALVVLQGVVDCRNAPFAQEAIRRAAWPGRSGICVDVRNLACIDGTGLQALVAEALDARQAGRPLRLRGATCRLLETLTRDGYLSLFGYEAAGEFLPPAPRSTVRIVLREERFSAPAEIGCLPEIRHRVVRFCHGIGLEQEALDFVHLAAGEAATNAIRHGCAEDPTKIIECLCAARDDQLAVEIRDPGTGFDPTSVGPPNPEELRPGGMGIYLMRAIMDEVDFNFGPEGTVARLVKRLPCTLAGGLSVLEGGAAPRHGEHVPDD
jgi:anti-sigma regulatory factor (Ser/Thr protein kinase)/anti-anti-sigma regulatory factor